MNIVFPAVLKLVAKSIGSEAIAVGEYREGPGKEMGSLQNSSYD